MADNSRMTRVATGAYELTVGNHKFEVLSERSPVMGAQGRPIGHTEWLGYIDGDCVSRADNATKVRSELEPMIEKAREVERVDRTKEQGRALLATLFDGLDNVPSSVTKKLDAYGAEYQTALEAALPSQKAIEPATPKASGDIDRDEQKKARAWANSHGIELNNRGQVPKDVLAAYRADDIDQVKSERRPNVGKLAEVEAVPPPDQAQETNESA